MTQGRISVHPSICLSFLTRTSQDHFTLTMVISAPFEALLPLPSWFQLKPSQPQVGHSNPSSRSYRNSGTSPSPSFFQYPPSKPNNILFPRPSQPPPNLSQVTTNSKAKRAKCHVNHMEQFQITLLCPSKALQAQRTRQPHSWPSLPFLGPSEPTPYAIRASYFFHLIRPSL